MTPTSDKFEADKIEAVLDAAHNAGRYTLLEHEVYQILEVLGLRLPSYVFLHSEDDITPGVMGRFASDRIVIKAASPSITHKQKAGAVKIVYKDLDFIKYSVACMRHALCNAGHDIQGFLLVEYVEYSKDLGNEVMLGFRESDAFGPVISFSKGGTDAEHFAANFSPPNLILPPIDRKWVEALLNSTKIQSKYVAEGRFDYTRKIVDAGTRFSRLATSFSNFFQTSGRYVIKEFEVNPFIFDPNGNFIALDGFARFDLRQTGMLDLEPGCQESLTPFFEPKGVAVVGLSRTDPDKTGNIIFRNLLRMGRSDLYGVNPGGGLTKVSGQPVSLYPSVGDIPGPVELVVISIPAEHTLPVIEDCAAKGVAAVILIPGGFSEIGKNIDIEQKILAIAHSSGIRIIGPNCLGIVYAGNNQQPGINTFFVPEEKFQINLEKENKVAILSQSGALGITEIYNLRNAISPKVIVSYGNQLDVDPGDLIRYFDQDPVVDVIGCYIEGFKKGGGRKFFNIASACQKPIIVYKAGRTQVGRKATESHTASIAGEYEVARAALKQAGLIVADTMIDHGDFIKTFALLNDFRARGNRVAIIANAGYEKTYAADNLGGLVVAEFDEETHSALEGILPPFVSADPLLDLTPMAGDEMFEQCIDIVLKSDSVDALFVSIVPHSGLIHTTDEEIDRDRENLAARIVRLVHKHRKPTVVSVNVVSGADAVYNKFGQVLDAGGVPTFLTASRAMICLNEFIRYRLTKERMELSEWLK